MREAHYDAVADIYVANFSGTDDPVLMCLLDMRGGAAAARRRGGVLVFSILRPCFAGTTAVTGSWPSGASYYDERSSTAAGPLSTLRQRVGANHRKLSTWLNVLRANDLWLDALEEPLPRAAWSSGERRKAAQQPVYLAARHVKR
jgi:hypothetical protein